MKAGFEVITPQKAAELLEKSNFKNRKLNSDIVQRYAGMIRSGQWKANGESIVMNCDGSIIDGQHRLHAVLKAGMPITTVVVRGVPASSFDTIDTGRKKTNADRLSMVGFLHCTNLASALIITEHMTNGGIPYDAKHAAGRLSLSSGESILAIANRHPLLPQSVAYVVSHKKKDGFTPPGLIATLHYLFGKSDEMKRNDFFGFFAKGLSGGDGCPIYALLQAHRSHSAKYAMKKSAQVQAAMWIKAWNAFKEGKPLTRLKWSPENNIFPEIL